MAIRLQLLRSGSSGNCALVSAGATHLLIDAGIGPRVLAKELAAQGLAVRDLAGVLYTHCHSDHLRAPTMALFGREGVPMYLHPATWETACGRGGHSALSALPAALVRHFEPDAPFELANVRIEAFEIPHGAPGPDNAAGAPVGFVLADGRDTAGYCTDIGHVTPRVLEALRPADLLVFESNHDLEMLRFSPRPYQTKQWIMGDYGHLNNGQAAEALAELFSGRDGAGVILAHLSEVCNTVGLANSTAREALAGRCDVTVGVALRHQASLPWVLENGRVSVGESAYAQPALGLWG